jgi:hypothetical protein
MTGFAGPLKAMYAHRESLVCSLPAQCSYYVNGYQETTVSNVATAHAVTTVPGEAVPGTVWCLSNSAPQQRSMSARITDVFKQQRSGTEHVSSSRKSSKELQGGLPGVSGAAAGVTDGEPAAQHEDQCLLEAAFLAGNVCDTSEKRHLHP